MTRVAVSILNYNSTQNTISCVESLLEANQKTSGTFHLEIFIADNASSDDESSQLKQSLGGLSNVYLQMNSENLGFAAGHNKNLCLVFAHSNPNFIWLLNSDCIVFEKTLVSLIECAQKQPEVGIWGATLLEPDGKTIQCAGGCNYNSWLGLNQVYGQGKNLTQLHKLESVDYDYIAGASLFLPAQTLQAGLGLSPQFPPNPLEADQKWLNESFFLYFEELDLAKRLKPEFGMAWCRQALIKHVGGVSTGTTDGQRSEMAEYHSSLSALKFTQFYYPRRLWFFGPVRYFLKCIQLLIKGEVCLIKALTRAYFDYWIE